MLKSLSRLLCAGVMTLAVAGAANAQESIHGYFRVQNASGISEKKGYVQVRGAFTAQPDQTFLQATNEAGTVMLIDATPREVNGKTVYQINNLRCQGIEVVGEPISNYYEEMQNIMTSGSIDTANEALWTMVRGGFKHGYTSIGRAFLQTMIWIVAARLDDECTPDELETLADFADRFNHEVAANIDLHICLEPVPNEKGEHLYRLFYDVPDLQCVSDWYLKPQNKATFEKGFDAMRRYMTAKNNGNTGEHFDESEIAEMKAWGYDVTEKHHTYDENGLYTPYDEIFADHELLYNWLKLNMIKFTDEDRCPKIELMGYYLPNFAKEMKNHALTAQLIGYFPRLKTNERVYLCDGKNDVFNHLDFTSPEGAEALGMAACWKLCPVTAKDDSYLCFKPNGSDAEAYYAGVYLDFPIQAVNPEITKIFKLTDGTKTKTINDVDYQYYELEAIEGGVAEAQTPLLIEMATNEPADYRVVPVYTLSLPDPVLPELPEPDGFEVSDDVVDNQRAPRRAAAMPENGFTGVLLNTPANAQSFKNMWDKEYDHSTAPVHRLGNTSIGNTSTLWYEPVEEGTTIPANEFILVKPRTAAEGYAVKEPKETPSLGVENIAADANAEETIVYDLKGNRVSELLPGQVYILNGKKILVR